MGCMQYIPSQARHICRNWSRRTTVTLSVGDSIWNVDVLKRKRICRFGKGWDSFTKDNNLFVGQTITFNYIAPKTFEVQIWDM